MGSEMCIRDRASGQEWHFDSDARNKAGAWMQSTKKLLDCGALLLKCGDDELAGLTDEWFTNLDLLKTETGEA